MRTVSEGLPLNWQELSYQDDIIAGAEFLSIFLRTRHQDTPTATDHDRTTLQTILDSDNDLIEYPKRELLRHSRSTSHAQPHTVTPPTTEQSSEGTTMAIGTTEMYDAIVSEERPSLYVNVNKSEFSVDEGEPIAHTAQEYPATEAMSDSNASPLYATAQGTVNQQNFVYHSYPESDDATGSVSYSRVVQELPQQTIVSSWNLQKPVTKSDSYDSDNSATAALDVNKTREEPPPVADQKTKANNWQLQMHVYPPSRRPVVYGKPEQNYEVDESVSIMTNGRTHGVQLDGKVATVPSLTNHSMDDSGDPNGQKVGYVVEGRNFRKYRVEERTSDGFIVGEYGVVSHNDGSLRGVRYTADSTINPRVIYDALMKFLSL